MKKQTYFVFGILVGVIMMICLTFINAKAEDRPTFEYFQKTVEKQAEESGRPEIVYRTERYVVAIFGLETCMKEFRYDRTNDSYQVKNIRKLEGSTKSLFNQEPYERLEEAIKYLEE